MSRRVVRAAYIERLGPPDVIRVGALPEPRLPSGHVLVAVEVAAVNPVDTYVRSGRYPTPTPFPFVVGRDLVGTVVDVAVDVDGFAPGDRVWCNSLGHDGRQGSFAERVSVPADRLVVLPAGVDASTAVAYLHPAATAWVGLVREASIRPGQRLLVGGGAGNVGSAAVHLAVSLGASVVATARPEDSAWCRGIGASAVFDHRDPAWSDRVAEVAPDGFDVVWNTSGMHDLEREVGAAAAGGTVLVTAADEPTVPVPLRDLYAQDVRLAGFVLSRASVADLQEASPTINEDLVAGPPVRATEEVSLEDTAEAHRRIEAGRIRGRIVVRVT